MKQNVVLKRTQFVSRYLEWLTQKDVELLDLNMIEAFYLEDKKYHPSNIIFERNNEIHAIRSDWTRSILNYKQLYNLTGNKYGYFGPVIRNNDTFYQAGLEMYAISEKEILTSIIEHLAFIQSESELPPRMIIVNDVEFIDLYIDKYQLADEIKDFIFDKDFSSLADHLGTKHPLYKMLTVPVSQQYDLVEKEFEQDERMQFIQEFKQSLAPYGIKFILDLSFRSPQQYYDGFYCQVFLDKNVPVLSGGQYAQDAFGLALNLSDGGIL